MESVVSVEFLSHGKGQRHSLTRPNDEVRVQAIATAPGKRVTGSLEYFHKEGSLADQLVLARGARDAAMAISRWLWQRSLERSLSLLQRMGTKTSRSMGPGELRRSKGMHQ